MAGKHGGGSSIQKVETLFRKAIKITFGKSQRTPYEIVFFKIGFLHLKAEVYKRQYKFWRKPSIKSENNPTSPVSLIFKMAIERNIHYFKHYVKLTNNFPDAYSCYKYYCNEFNDTLNKKFENKTNTQIHGILTNYMLINNVLMFSLLRD